MLHFRRCTRPSKNYPQYNTLTYMSIANNVLRAGKKYRLVNFGEKYDFAILSFKGPSDALLKDLYTLETYLLSDLTRYGRGKDYSLDELEEGGI